MNILVTGGAGYIGSFMVNRLIERGDIVTVIDSIERGHEEKIHPKASFLKCDVFDWEPLEKLFKEKQFDVVAHFAGYISMEESTKDPGLYFHKNTGGALEILEHAVRNNVKSFIFSSTAGVYGNPLKIPIPENHPTNPTNPYGESKLAVERMLHWYQKVYGLNFAALRYFNAAGAMQDGSNGENHDPETHIIPLAIDAALTGGEFNLYGQDYDTPDGTAIRDYIHVLDLVEAHVLAIDKLANESGRVVYNVGVGKGYSNQEVIDMVKKVSGVNFKINLKPRRSGDAEKLIADSTKTVKELNFLARYSDLETIVETAWKWHKKMKK